MLSLSPLLFEKYLTAAESILEQAIVTDTTPCAFEDAARRDPRHGRGEWRETRLGPIPPRDWVIPGFKASFDEGITPSMCRPSASRLVIKPVRAIVRINGEDIHEFDVTGDRANPTRIEQKVRLKAGPRRSRLRSLTPTPTPRTVTPTRTADSSSSVGSSWTDRITFLLPVLPETHRRIMAHQPGAPAREAAPRDRGTIRGAGVSPSGQAGRG